jgi:hypothetical protein
MTNHVGPFDIFWDEVYFDGRRYPNPQYKVRSDARRDAAALWATLSLVEIKEYVEVNMFIKIQFRFPG